MSQNFNPFKNYTSTAMLSGVNEENLTRRSIQYFNKNILPYLPVAKNARIVEVGCGYGRHMKAMETLGYNNVSGIDISEEQVAYAVEKLGLNNVSIADALEYFTKIEEKFDVILLLDVIEHLELEYSISLLKLVRTKLNSNGVLILQAPNGLSPLSPHRYWDVTHLRAYTTHSMEQTLRLADFNNMQHNELHPPIGGIISFMQRTVWELFFRPVIAIYMLTTQGYLMGGIFTANMLTIVNKE